MLNYTMDVFVEYMVKRKKSGKNLAMIFGAVFGGLLIMFLSLTILPAIIGIEFFSFVFFIIAGAIYGIYYVVTLFNLEFEYAFTNGDISIDKIVNQKARKRLTSFDCKSIEEMGDYTQNAQKLSQRTFEKKIFAGTYEDGTDSVYIVANSKKTGLTLIVFDPSERIIESMKNFLPRHVRTEYYGRGK